MSRQPYDPDSSTNPAHHRNPGTISWDRTSYGRYWPAEESIATRGTASPAAAYTHTSQQYHTSFSNSYNIQDQSPGNYQQVPLSTPPSYRDRHVSYAPGPPDNEYSRRGFAPPQAQLDPRPSFPHDRRTATKSSVFQNPLDQSPNFQARQRVFNHNQADVVVSKSTHQLSRPQVPSHADYNSLHTREVRAPNPPTIPQPQPMKLLATVPNLLSQENEHVLAHIKFGLSVRQQPKAARACGSGERDRRNIDPPPVVQLHVSAPGVAEDEINRYLRHEGYVVNCSIYDETGTRDASHMPAEYRHQRRLTGSLVSTSFWGKDENGKEGCFFPFSDLSVRTLGRYRLKFSVIMLDSTRPGQSRHFPTLAETFSSVFDVYTAKDFPGINESSKLVRTLREQGCIIAIKKGNDKKKRGRQIDDDELEEEDDDSDDQRSRGSKEARK